MGLNVEYLQYIECADKLYFTMKMPFAGNFPFLADLDTIILLRDVH
jgi:hypothetical protein